LVGNRGHVAVYDFLHGGYYDRRLTGWQCYYALDGCLADRLAHDGSVVVTSNLVKQIDIVNYKTVSEIGYVTI
jgi:hypothetical protein